MRLSVGWPIASSTKVKTVDQPEAQHKSSNTPRTDILTPYSIASRHSFPKHYDMCTHIQKLFGDTYSKLLMSWLQCCVEPTEQHHQYTRTLIMCAPHIADKHVANVQEGWLRFVLVTMYTLTPILTRPDTVTYMLLLTHRYKNVGILVSHKVVTGNIAQKHWWRGTYTEGTKQMSKVRWMYK